MPSEAAPARPDRLVSTLETIARCHERNEGRAIRTLPSCDERGSPYIMPPMPPAAPAPAAA